MPVGCEGIRRSPLEVIINLFISLGHGLKTAGSTHSSLAIFLPGSPSLDILYCRHGHAMTCSITVITKRWNEVIFVFTNNRLSKPQMKLLPPVMWNRYITFKFQFIFLWTPLSYGAATHTIVLCSILLAVRQWDFDAVCQRRLIFHLSSILLQNMALWLLHSDECFPGVSWMV